MRPLSSRLSLTLVLALGVAVAGCDRGGADKAQESSADEVAGQATGSIDRAAAGELMPTAEVKDPDGKTLNLGALQGTPVLLNLWATWCAPCIEEMPQLDALAGDYEGRVRVLTVSQDMAGAEKVVPFFAERKFAHLEPWLDEANDLGFAIGGGTLPTTVLYDGSGREVWRVVGAYDWSSEKARAAVEEGLAK